MSVPSTIKRCVASCESFNNICQPRVLMAEIAEMDEAKQVADSVEAKEEEDSEADSQEDLEDEAKRSSLSKASQNALPDHSVIENAL